MHLAWRAGLIDAWEQMLEPLRHSRVGRLADGDAESDFGARWPEEDFEPSRRPGWGQYPGWVGVFTVLAAALLGAAFTVASHREPGLALGVFIAAGTVAAGISVRARSAYAIIPVPALAYAATAAISGLIHDRAVDTSRTILTVNAVQWIANGFIAITGATIVAVLLAVARWLHSRREARAYW